MDDFALDLHTKILLEEFRAIRPSVEILQKVVMEKLNELVESSGIELNAVESRVKSEQSLVGKLERKGHKYQSVKDVTDLFGARIIVFFNEDVDRIASMAEALFDIDWENSVDKRCIHNYDTFGYNSLHYICKLPVSLYYDPEHPELNAMPFELQMRTALQHVWSVIQHDIGYKSEIDIPVEYKRNISRLAGLLELADNEFSRIRSSVSDYHRRTQLLMKKGQLDQITLDGDTFRTYLSMRPFDNLNRRIAGINQAELHVSSVLHYLKALRHMGLNTLADIEQMLHDDADDAYQLALIQLGSTDIDILSDSVGIQNLCIVHILKTGGTEANLCEFFNLINGRSKQHEVMASYIVEQAQRLAFMNIDKEK